MARRRKSILGDQEARILTSAMQLTRNSIYTAQHMNPNFAGYLYLGLYNATPNIIDIYPDLTIGQMVFEEICGSITTSKLYDRKKDAKYQDEDQFISPRLDDLSEEDKRKVHAIVKDLMGA